MGYTEVIMGETCPNCVKHKHTPRSEEEAKNLKNRLNKIQGQVNGISKMIDDNRYCGDILIQIASIERSLQEVGYIILKTHMDTCVRDDIKNDKPEVIDETIDLIRKLK